MGAGADEDGQGVGVGRWDVGTVGNEGGQEWVGAGVGGSWGLGGGGERGCGGGVRSLEQLCDTEEERLRSKSHLNIEAQISTDTCLGK